MLIPVLPSELKEYIESIFPYIIGVSPEMIERVEIPEDAYVVNLDTGEVSKRKILPRLPEKPHKLLLKRLV